AQPTRAGDDLDWMYKIAQYCQGSLLPSIVSRKGTMPCEKAERTTQSSPARHSLTRAGGNLDTE
ncbi:MAG: hypothetical protein ACK5DD_01085, partial [Cyclobacteriaceae bacterium]